MRISTIKKTIAFLIAIALLLIIPHYAFAATCSETSSCPPALLGLTGTVENIVQVFLVVSGVVFFFMMIFGGFSFITANGEPEQLNTAKKQITFSAIGFGCLFASFIILRIIIAVTSPNTNSLTDNNGNVAFKPNTGYSATPLPSAKINKTTPTIQIGNLGSLGSNFLGAFNVVNTTELANLHKNLPEENVLIQWGNGGNLSADSDLCTALRANNIYIIDAWVAWDEQDPSQDGGATDGSANIDGFKTNFNAHLQQTSLCKSQIKGFWVLDDQGNRGGYDAQEKILQAAHDIISQQFPGTPAICGFGTNFGDAAGDGNYIDPTSGQNFFKDYSPTRCDMIGIYAYPSPGTGHTASWYDWTMKQLWIDTQAKFVQETGYNLTNIPFFGLPIAFTQNGYPYPSAAEIAQNAQAWCQYGASGIIYWAWDPTEFIGVSGGAGTNGNTTFIQGMQQGDELCQTAWQH